MSLPLVSIILPVYNASAFLGIALRRLEEQSYPNFEVVVVDDGSVDDSLAIVREFQDNLRVRAIRFDDNRGVAAARNAGIDSAKGDYYWFVDVDDEWSSEFLASLVPIALRDASDVVVCGARYRSTLRSGVETELVTVAEDRFCSGLEATAVLLRGTGALWNKLFRRTVFDSHRFPSLLSKSDHAWLLSALPNLQRVSTFHKSLYLYVRRPGSISNGGVAQPMNFIRLIPILEGSMKVLSNSPRAAHLERNAYYDIVSRAVREVWRFQTVSEDEVTILRGLISVRDLFELDHWDSRVVPTCIGFLVAPRISGRLFRMVGRSRWS